MSKIVNIDGLVFSTLDITATVDACVASLGRSGPADWFACVNPYSVETSRRDPAYAAALRDANILTADGVGIVFASRILGGAICSRVSGPDLFAELCARLNRERAGTRVFFLAATNDTSQALIKRFQEDFENLVVAGTFVPTVNPTFTPAEDKEIVAAVNAAHAEVLWIGLGQPRQEKLVHRLRAQFNVRLVGPVGAVFDFYTGRVKLPPVWAQRLGLIWLVRLCQQPRRLLRRNVLACMFVIRVVLQAVRFRLVSFLRARLSFSRR